MNSTTDGPPVMTLQFWKVERVHWSVELFYKTPH